MFKYKFYDFYNKEINALTIQFENTKFLIGGFFTESSLVDSALEIKNNKKEVKYFPFTYNKKNNNEIENNSDIMKIKEIFKELKIIIITNLEYLSNYILLLKMIKNNKDIFNIEENTVDNILMYSTEPIIQFGSIYLKEFYETYNKMLLNINKDNKFINTFISNEEINIFIKKIIKLAYWEKINYLVRLTSNLNEILTSEYILEKNIIFELISNGYNLGSSNIIIYYYNKKILIITNSSLYRYRYPKEFDNIRILNSDYLLCFPNIVNKDNNYENNFENLKNFLDKTSNMFFNKNNVHKYPYILILCDIYFLMDFSDLFRHKINKTVQLIYFSPSANLLLKLGNISLGYLNTNLTNKLFDFKLPFSFDEMIKENRIIFYKDLISFKNELSEYIKKKDKKGYIYLKNFIEQNNCFFFITHKFDFIINSIINNNYIMDFFINNYEPQYDKIIIVNSNKYFQSENYINYIKSTYNNIDINKFNLDHSFTQNQYCEIIKKISPKNILNNDVFNEYRYIEDNDVFYENSYLLNKNKNGINELDNNIKLDAEFSCEQLRYNIKINKSENNKNENKIINYYENIEKIIQNYLKINSMEITEFLNKENSIELTIFNNNKKTYTEVIISNIYKESEKKENNFPEININSEDIDDIYFLNGIFSNIFQEQ